MNVLAVDDERLALAALTAAIEEAEPSTQVSGFRTSTEALASLDERAYQVAFLDIELRECSGIELAAELKGRCPGLHIIFVTGYSQYAVDAFALHADGYVMKPVSPERIRTELDHLRLDAENNAEPGDEGLVPRLRIQCLGNFEAFIDGVPVTFGRTKTKELFAYLVDRRGAMCSNGELMAALWEDDNHEPYLRQLKKDLVDSLEVAGCSDVLERRRGGIAIVADKVSCDYYDLLDGKDSRGAFRGEYMEQYSWAETTKGSL